MVSWPDSDTPQAGITWRRSLRQLAMGSFLFCLSCNSVWDPWLISRVSFGSATNFPVGITPRAVALGDFNSDMKLDFAVANYGNNNVSVLLSSSVGGFGDATHFSVGMTPYWVAVGDFNSDRLPDLVIANYRSNNVSMLLGNGMGSFAAVADFSAGTGPIAVAVEDFNGDKKADLVIANYDSGNVSVLLNQSE